MKLTSLTYLIIVASLGSVALAETYYVDGTNGNDGWDGLSETYLGDQQGPKRTINEGIRAANNDGDVVVVADGVYSGYLNLNIDLRSFLITFRSANGPDNCVIDCDHTERPILLDRRSEDWEPKAVLDGFTLRGRSSYGRQIDFFSDSNAIVRNCIFTGCSDVELGVLVCRGQSTPSVINCTFEGNYASDYGSAGIVCLDDSQPTISGCVIEGPVPTMTSDKVSNGVYCFDRSSVSITNCLIAGTWGAGLCVMDESIVTVTGSEVSNNWGGGVYCELFETGSVEINDCIVADNQSYIGGGIFVERGSATIRNSEIISNWAEESASGIYCGDSASLILKDSSVVGNYCEHQGGAGVKLKQCQAVIDGCQISGNMNVQVRSEGISSYQSSLSVSNSVISNNSSYGSRDNAVSVLYGSVSLSNCLITVSSNSDYSTCLFFYNVEEPVLMDNCTVVVSPLSDNNHCVENRNSDLTLNNSILWGTQDSLLDDGERYVVVNYSDVQGGWEGDGVGNIDVDPEFAEDGLDEFGEPVPFAVKDYYLKSTAGRYDGATEIWVQDDIDSPCIDAGDPGYSVGDEPLGSGGLINMGAYGGTVEASLTDICNGPVAGDINNDCTVDFVDFAMLAGNWLVSTLEE